jgi:hypothetical protein
VEEKSEIYSPFKKFMKKFKVMHYEKKMWWQSLKNDIIYYGLNDCHWVWH